MGLERREVYIRLGRSVTSDEWAVLVYHCRGYGKIVCV